MANVNVHLMEQRISCRKLLIRELGQAAATSEGHGVTAPDLPQKRPKIVTLEWP